MSLEEFNIENVGRAEETMGRPKLGIVTLWKQGPQQGGNELDEQSWLRKVH